MRKFFAGAALSLLLTATATAAPTTRKQQYSQAVRLYEQGMYQEAKGLLENINRTSPDGLSVGYEVLCGIRLKSDGYENDITKYEKTYVRSVVYPQIHYLYGLNLFDEERYEEASSQFSLVRQGKLDRKQVKEFLFKQAYCDFGLEKYSEAEGKFRNVEKLEFSDYTAPSRYALGYIAYNRNDFNSAIDWFTKSSTDPRFEASSKYYLVECHFMNKDYRYVEKNGEDVYRIIPEERKPHLARILSESYLVLGDAAKAKEYFDKDVQTKTNMNRSDYFYAGSLQYALENYQEAVSNFERMDNRTDSLGQIANYELGYSYIQIKNKVSALESFKQASECDYSTDIQEDAFFNYAKLAFDLNHDASVFEKYLAKYSDTKRGDMIYNYIAVAYLYNHDYAAAIQAYDRIDVLTPEMRMNYMKANYLWANQLIGKGSYRDAIECLRSASFFTDRQNNFNKLSRYWLAEAYFKTDNFTEAEKIYQDLYNLSALENQDEGRALSYNIAYCFFKDGDYISAARWFDQYIASGNRSWREDAETRRADCDFLVKDYKSAAANYQKVLDEFGYASSVYPYYRMGLSYGLAGNVNKKIAALSKVEEASVTDPFYSDALYELGRAYVEGKKVNDATRCFETLVRQSKDSTFIARSLIELGMISRNKSDMDKSLEYYKRVIEEMPVGEYHDDALFAIEAIYQKRGETDKYLAYLEEIGSPSQKSEKEKELMYFSSAEQIFLSENYQKAIVSLNNYLQNYPDGEKAGQALYYIADSYRITGDKEKACDYYSQCVEESDGKSSYSELAMLNFAQLSFDLGRYQESYNAWKALRASGKIDANLRAAEYGMMESAFSAKDYAEAIKAADVLIVNPQNSEAVVRESEYVKAKSLLASSNRTEAFAILKLLSLNPSTPEGAESTYLLIQNAYDQGNFDQVETMVYDFSAKAGGQSYWLAKAYIVLGDSFAEVDNFKQAKATYESLLEGYEPSEGVSDDVLDNVRMRLSKLDELSK